MVLPNNIFAKDAMQAATLVNPQATSSVLLVCEHASNFIPADYAMLGLPEDAKQSHIAWDPGALELSCHLADLLDARLVHSNISRLIYDCNRPPKALDAMPASSEGRVIPGNENIDDNERARRIAWFYDPFKTLLADTIASMPDKPILVTIHSFTPIYNGQARDVEFGILHDSDSRLADLMLEHASTHTKLNVMRNKPYGPQDGVTHTLKQHGVNNGCLNVMLEISNVLLSSDSKQKEIASMIAALLSDALGKLDKNEVAA
ncbi:N-formylglutamate amidohydrolase [uncultured Candidatus Puniceispirillum sp.]|uniref:N-formylglutamate amidohydrolase n=1 Tax=uncultured Candidatus Puniceispirillum sp. TaxID=1985115 RepID=UPI002A745467|nr:N-formylglutamate amidohydrolase [Candidatus Puniceispirillum sp.]